jgi:hypothetical protein
MLKIGASLFAFAPIVNRFDSPLIARSYDGEAPTKSVRQNGLRKASKRQTTNVGRAETRPDQRSPSPPLMAESFGGALAISLGMGVDPSPPSNPHTKPHLV